jgi:cytidylate kinase
VLLDQPDVLRVFLRAPFEFRVRAIMDSHKLEEAEARKFLKHRDANSAAYIRQVYDHDWQHPSHYDLVIDTARLGHMRAVEVILAAVPK